ncbi:DUF47 domain-containing protein [Zhaonella formicivorans]|uniref:DUF47 domain-containing protein n=1 Tax=Zhaonella formicivorans TaxID=2528593 RepID=UPI0010F36FCC|nr:DUF47 family protein [Zhaonella formicivorans]
MFKLTPKEDKFFDLFISSAHTMYKAAQLLKELVEDLKNGESKFKEIKEMERKGDQQLHEIFKELNKSFITPIDREDIYGIGKQMDDIADFIESTASRFIMFKVTAATEEAKTMSNLILNCTKELIDLMEELKVMKKSKKLTEKIIEINRIEEEGDALFRQAVTGLFSGNTPVIDVIKWKEIYERLEQTLDACEDVANIVEGVVMKHA